MLCELSIRDIVLIEQLDISFSDGLSVLTGETGAGKSILLDSLALALGARGDGGLVRAGCDRGTVTAVFSGPYPRKLMTLFSENEITVGDELILRRVQNADGRTRGFVNDEAVSAGLMRKIGQQLVEIHGQHDDRALMDPDSHRSLLDAYGGHEEQVRLVSHAWQSLRQARKELAELQARVEAAAREADYLRASAAELQLLAPEPGEETRLAEKRQRMMQVEKIATDLNEAYESISGQGSPVPELASLARRLERKKADVPNLLDGVVDHLDEALNGLYGAQNELENAIRETEFDPRELEATEERLFALRAASRKYSVAVENLPELAVKMADDMEALDAGEEQLRALGKTVSERETQYAGLARELSAMREATSGKLVEAVMAELPALKLEQAEFIVDLKSGDDQASARGIDTVEFWVRTNPGTKAGPMGKVASGGELSRFLLALKVALADRGSAPTLIFDEIDTGVGGAVADAIGQRLSRLSKNVQVLSVTHAPQVAARATGHMLISKQMSDLQATEKSEESSADNGFGKRMATGVRVIAGDERREEIARMLAGATITDEARAAAARLLGT